MTTKRKLWALAIVGVLLLAVANHALNPLRWSDENLRGWLLEQVPIGSSVERLQSAATEHGWAVIAIWEHGAGSEGAGVQGDTVVRVHLGGYRALFWTEVGSYWIFDETGRLQDVRIERFADSP